MAQVNVRSKKKNQWFFRVVIIEYQKLKSVVLDFHQSHNMITDFYENSAKGLEVEMDTHACTHTCAYEVWQKSNAIGNAVHEPTMLLPPPSYGS
jgi:hypothetical protein